MKTKNIFMIFTTILIFLISMSLNGCKTTKPEAISASLPAAAVTSEGECYKSAVAPSEISSWPMVYEHIIMIPIMPMIGMPAIERYFVNPDEDAPIRYGATASWMDEKLQCYVYIYKGSVYLFRKNSESNCWEEKELSEDGQRLWIQDFISYGQYPEQKMMNILNGEEVAA